MKYYIIKIYKEYEKLGAQEILKKKEKRNRKKGKKNEQNKVSLVEPETFNPSGMCSITAAN